MSGIGDVFEMKIFNEVLGEYMIENHVVEFELDRRIAWEPVGHRRFPRRPHSDNKPHPFHHSISLANGTGRGDVPGPLGGPAPTRRV